MRGAVRTEFIRRLEAGQFRQARAGAQAWIQKRTRKKLSESGVRKVLRRLGGKLKVPRKSHAQPVAYGHELVADLPAVVEQFPQREGGLVHRDVQAGLHLLAEAAEQLGIEPVGLGEQAFGVGEGAHAAGFDDADFELGQQERRDDRAFVAAGGFADHTHPA